MFEQIAFLPDVDKKKTKKAVEAAFKAYRMYKTMPISYGGPSENLTAAVVSCDADMIRGQNRDISAANTINTYLERVQTVKSIEEVVANLPVTEQTILKDTMMKADDMCDSDTWVMDKLGLGKTKYYDVKWRAILRVAFALRIEVMVVKEESKAA